MVKTDHRQYTGDLSLEEQAGIISRAEGRVGYNADYLSRTVDRLNQLGLEYPSMEKWNSMVSDFLGQEVARRSKDIHPNQRPLPF